MLKSLGTAAFAAALLGSGSVALAQRFSADQCPDLCLKRCAIRQMAPGLYRGECQQGCMRNCYRTMTEGGPGAGARAARPQR